jgi:hypothetical protein
VIDLLVLSRILRFLELPFSDIRQAFAVRKLISTLGSSTKALAHDLDQDKNLDIALLSQ